MFWVIQRLNKSIGLFETQVEAEQQVQNWFANRNETYKAIPVSKSLIYYRSAKELLCAYTVYSNKHPVSANLRIDSDNVYVELPFEIKSEPPMKCYWCDQHIKDITRDHLLSNFIRRTFCADMQDRTKTRSACYNCNQQRGRISCLFELVWRAERNNWDGMNSKPPVETLIRGKRKVEPHLSKFKNKIAQNLGNTHYRQLCLMEIDAIERFTEEVVGARAPTG